MPQLFWWTGCSGIVGGDDPGQYLLMGEFFFDKLAGEARPGGEKPCIYCFDPCCNYWAKNNPVVPDIEVLLAVEC